ncbi:MAG: PIG-L deacetylase family protein [Bacteroidota bacterium]|nr:PIG-L deacetylase family protein [Bacteroidota bacterium]
MKEDLIMKLKNMQLFLGCLLILILPLKCLAQGEGGPADQKKADDITKWTNKTIMWVGPHEDDETSCMGTLSILKQNGNKIIMIWYTTGNKGSRDLEMTSERLAQIRKTESEKALNEMGISSSTDTFICLGYDDGMLEYVPDLELTEKVCKLIRKYRPDAVFSMDPGDTYTRWLKTDHRASAFITLDAARAAAYHLYFPSHRIYEGLQPFTVTDYFFYSSRETNFDVDITKVSDKKIRARSWYVSQFGPGNLKYIGPDPDQENLNKQLKANAERIAKGEKIYEKFRRVSESLSF